MSSRKSVPVLVLDIGPSIYLNLSNTLLHGLAALALVTAQLPGRLVVLGLALLPLTWLWRWHRHYRDGAAQRIRTLMYDGQQWVLYSGNGRAYPAQLLNYYLRRQRIVMRFALGRWRWRTLILDEQTVHPELLRRLRQYLWQL